MGSVLPANGGLIKGLSAAVITFEITFEVVANSILAVAAVSNPLSGWAN